MFFMISRQGYYNNLLQEKKEVLEHTLILEQVREIRYDHPEMGGKKLYHLTHRSMQEMGLKMGRDKFFDLLRKNGMLVKRRRKYVVTTQSHHRFRVYGNALQRSVIKGPNEAWVCDITYIRVKSGFIFLFLITDVFSRKIVGWYLSIDQTVASGLKALNMAIAQAKITDNIVHHSDRGFQYCAPKYIKRALKKNMIISMGEAGNCYDNAMAERVNGILKNEYALDTTFEDYTQALKAVKHAIKCYNEKRPHWSLNLRIPQNVHEAA